MLLLVVILWLANAAGSSDHLASISKSAKFKNFAHFCLDSQQRIIQTLEQQEEEHFFQQDPWDRKDSVTGELSGCGITAVIERGQLLEKGAVSTTIVRGILSEERANAMSSRGRGGGENLVGSVYYASALSIVLHSRSPMVPTFRADVRYFELEKTGAGWFGGGADLTPYYLFDEDAKDFHTSYQHICNKFSPDLFPKYKQWCDKYFYLPARREHRGVGGIFFDDLDGLFTDACLSTDASTEEGSLALKKATEFTMEVCSNFMPSYLPIVQRRRNLKYTDEQRQWQLLRRGRYIEFNMLYDRGVKFGLTPGGRIEAVFVSCPPMVAWDYNHSPEEGSEEARLMDILKNPREWV